MGKIKLLDNITIQKIAAGEVIERPLSIVKELIENSLDANSENIIIEIKNGGKSYIRVTDDGDGIEDEDLNLAFKRHSTSKLSTIEDLYRIKSLGFRGEALASISHVSKVEVMTKTSNAVGGIHAIVEEGEIKSKEVVGCPKGTTLIVKDLFYNLPVRKEFLKSDLVESNQISDIVYKVALGNLNTSFKFIRDDKVVLKTSKNNDMKTHIYSILGKEFSNNLVQIDFEEYGIHLHGYISNNNLYRSNRNHQYIYINGRYINNINISNTIENHYKSLIPLNRFPCFILFIELDPSTIDVNIHPTKQEIKFANQSEIFSVIDKAIKDTLYPSLSVPKVGFKETKEKIKEEKPPLLFMNTNANIQDDIVVKDFTRKSIFEEEKLNEPHGSSMRLENELLIREDIGREVIPSNESIEKLNESHGASIRSEVDDSPDDIKNILSDIEPIGVIFNTYILADDKVNEKLYFIDQHAAHERVMYEKYLEEYSNENIIAQQLLIPEIAELTNSEMSDFLENISIFKKLGFDIEEFGNNSVVIRSVPLVFGVPNIRELFYDLLDNINNIKSNYDTKLEKIMKLACTKAVKSGDHMSEIEMFSLFEQLKRCNNPHSCPHGRPTVLEMSKTDIEKAFLRIM
ncbi:DNA mismatch repair endonuclease MutL [Tissierella carlieri]|jgi:DNA mismatch repair protein MutL|uniref:DNA mismatch repair endonuclease MutL n=1 Tax=Tissierella TaxID=41273 RepID=UPI0028053976|nr:DNA mismatch repair endonuclease MutL [uncultured Tissierella sp.]MDU5079953.1 DNA mismatch repair endonuclease MutL [Bacillota bacterium]